MAQRTDVRGSGFTEDRKGILNTQLRGGERVPDTREGRATKLGEGRGGGGEGASGRASLHSHCEMLEKRCYRRSHTCPARHETTDAERIGAVLWKHSCSKIRGTQDPSRCPPGIHTSRPHWRTPAPEVHLEHPETRGSAGQKDRRRPSSAEPGRQEGKRHPVQGTHVGDTCTNTVIPSQRERKGLPKQPLENRKVRGI